jgi:hypothetical protein
MEEAGSLLSTDKECLCNSQVAILFYCDALDVRMAASRAVLNIPLL